MTGLTKPVKTILDNYAGEAPGVRASLARILMQGKLAGTGRVVILPVDQGFEHGPARSFAKNPPAYDPLYHYQLALEAGLSAYAAPMGSLAVGAEQFAGILPTIMKMNSGNSLSENPDQAVTAPVREALRLGCVGIGFTVYPGAPGQFEMFEEIREMAREAKSYGLCVVIWSYPRGGILTKQGETALDVIAYAAHMAALLGAHIIKVKPPTAHLELAEAKKTYQEQGIKTDTLKDRIAHIMQACFNGRRMVVFSGGAAKDKNELLAEIKSLREGGATGSIVGRNSFQRPKEEAVKLLSDIIDIYKN